MYETPAESVLSRCQGQSIVLLCSKHLVLKSFKYHLQINSLVNLTSNDSIEFFCNSCFSVKSILAGSFMNSAKSLPSRDLTFNPRPEASLVFTLSCLDNCANSPLLARLRYLLNIAHVVMKQTQMCVYT